ncbi:MAG: M55 family metallopeptidase [Actinomycetota bacterium]|nr:M55 family metallopeptidase [Actinomycetota bacterium]
MKVYISSDIEGCAGIVDWDQVLPGRSDYELGRRLLLGEVNAAIEGAVAGGATEIVVNDSHHRMANLDPEQLAQPASYISGHNKPLYMMEGLDRSFDAAFFVAYHGAIDGPPAVLSHTYNPAAIAGATLNGTLTGESGINALVAAAFDVPIVLITGDDVTAKQAEPFMPDAEKAVVKHSISRSAAHSLHPDAARALIRDSAQRALENADGMSVPSIDQPARLELTFLDADFAELAQRLTAVERTDTRRISILNDDLLQLYRDFVTLISLTRSLV